MDTYNRQTFMSEDMAPSRPPFHVQLPIMATVTATPVADGYRITRDGMFMGRIFGQPGSYCAYKENAKAKLPGGPFPTMAAAATALWHSIY